MSMKILSALTDGLIALKQAMPTFGKPRSLAKGETASTWREVTVGTETFRVLTMEDGK